MSTPAGKNREAFHRHNTEPKARLTEHIYFYLDKVQRPSMQTHATSYNIVNLANITLSERSQAQKATHVIPFIQNIQNGPIHTERKYISGCQGLRD